MRNCAAQSSLLPRYNEHFTRGHGTASTFGLSNGLLLPLQLRRYPTRNRVANRIDFADGRGDREANPGVRFLRPFDQLGEVFARVRTRSEKQRNHANLLRVLIDQSLHARRKIWLHEFEKRQLGELGRVHAAKVGEDGVERHAPLRVARAVSEKEDRGHDFGVGQRARTRNVRAAIMRLCDVC